MSANPPATTGPNNASGDVAKFYDTLSTLPKLIGDIGMDIAESQRRLDQNYLESLAAFTDAIRHTFKDGVSVDQYLSLFKAIAPSRYQFTETNIEVRADLQTASASELNIGVNVGIKTAVFSAAVNVSYMKRSASDYQASALIRTTLNAIPADPGVMDKLLAHVSTSPGAPLMDPRYEALMEAFSKVLGGAVSSPPHV
jgi:hypothetical protein